MKKCLKYIFVTFIVMFIYNMNVRAENILVERIMIDTPSPFVDFSKSMYMTAKIYPSNATNKEVIWSSSNTSIASIDSETGGLTTKSTSGIVTITATAKDGSGVIGTVKLKVGYVHVMVDEELSISNNNWVSYDTVNWEIEDPTILKTLNRSGYSSIGSSYRHYLYVKGLKNGETTVKMKTISGDVLASNKVYVYTPIEGIESEEASYKIEKGLTKQLSISFLPESVSSEYKVLHYMSDDSTIASVDENGIITGVNTGKTNIRVSSQFYEKTITIPVEVIISPTDINLIETEISLNNDNSTHQIEYEILPVNATNKEVIYTSENENIAIVDENGKVIAISNGETNINILTKEGNISKKIHVTVSNLISCTELQFNTDTIRVNSGKTFKVNYSKIPSTCTNVKVYWKVDDQSIATVDSNGNVTGVKTGETDLIITAENGLKYTKKINVNNYVAIESFDIRDSKIVVTTDGKVPTYRVKYDIFPSDATFKNINWVVDDENIAVVDSNGTIKAISNGKTKLTGTTMEGSFVDSVDIEVITGYFDIRVGYINPQEITYQTDGCSYYNHFADEKRVYYPEKYNLLDYYEMDGLRINDFYFDMSCSNYSYNLSNKVSSNYEFEYSGGSYDLYAANLSEIPINSIELFDKYLNTRYEYFTEVDSTSTWQFNLFLNKGKNLPFKKTLRVTSENDKVIKFVDEYVDAYCNLDYCYFDIHIQSFGLGKTKVNVCSQDGNVCDQMYVNTESGKKTRTIYLNDGDYKIEVLSGTTVQEFYEDFNQPYGANYYLVNANNEKVGKKEYINSSMTYIPVDLSGKEYSNIFDDEDIYNKYKAKKINMFYQIDICDKNISVMKKIDSNSSSTSYFNDYLAAEKGDIIQLGCSEKCNLRIIKKSTNSDVTSSVSLRKINDYGYEFTMPDYEVKILSISNLNVPTISYSTHVQSIGWQEYVYDGTMSGTSGKGLRLEGIKIKLQNQPYTGNIEYRTHIQNIGWETSFKKNNEMSGTSGKALRLEAIQIKLTGEMAKQYDVYYRVHAQHFGWLGWAKNGESSGTAGYGYRLEGIEIKLVKKGKIFSDYGKLAYFHDKKFESPTVSYTTHVQSVGWQSYVEDGQMAGTSGKGLRLEGIKIKLPNQPYSGNIEYRTHVQNIGWQNYVKNDEMSGTSGKSLRLEAIQIRLTGEMAKHYDVYYRVHAQHFGWLGWSRNGEESGTAGYGYRLEGIEIKLVPKGKTVNGYGTTIAYYKK